MTPEAVLPKRPLSAARSGRGFIGATARSARRDGPLLVLALALVVLGVALRCNALDFPKNLTWDEHHFVENARNYIAGRHDWNDHPPFGKLLIVPWLLALGDTSRSWRLSQLVCGLVSIVIAYGLGGSLFRDRRAALLAAAFVAGDGFLIVFSRTALLDGMLTTFVLASVYAAVRARRPLGYVVTGVLIGLAANVKMSAFALGVPAVLLVLARARPSISWRTLLNLFALSAALFTYTAVYDVGLALVHEPYGILEPWKVSFALLHGHYQAQSFTHPFTSHWYAWALPTRPITLRYDAVAPHTFRTMTTLGNLVLWWTAVVAFLAALVQCAVALFRMANARSRTLRLGRQTRGTLTLTAFALSMILPWVIGKRDSYIYHYLPTYACLLVLVAGRVVAIYRQRRMVALGFTAVVVLVSMFYAPVWGQLPVDKKAFEARLFVPHWR